MLSIIIWSCFVMQFDPATRTDSATLTATESGSTEKYPTQDNTQRATTPTTTTAAVVTVTPTVAMTTSGGITTNVTMETTPNKTSNDSETSKLLESNKGRSETLTGDNEQVEEKANQSSATNDNSAIDDTSEKQLVTNPVISPELKPPVSPTGSIHSDSGASQTGVRSHIDK